MIQGRNARIISQVMAGAEWFGPNPVSSAETQPVEIAAPIHRDEPAP
jgi:hypothetical protein